MKLFLVALMFLPILAFAQVPATSPINQAALEDVAADPIPQGLVDTLSAIESLPYIGPVVSKIIMYAGILGTLMTILATFVIGVIKAVGPVLANQKSQDVEAFVQKALDSKVVYYLKWFSFYNAKKKPVVETVKAQV